ncbi:hypothetical protein DFJ63DRAFT_287900 [Scheffersomyces coipomensis]|uniref:uncharacterized protein n=1 Tax=Scheffersomyces coipomensis TaxID=1788519 RepID=UPI00315DF801
MSVAQGVVAAYEGNPEEKDKQSKSKTSPSRISGEHIRPISSNSSSKKDHSFSSKLDFLLKPAKFSSKSSIEDDHRSETPKVVINDNVEPEINNIHNRPDSPSDFVPTSNVHFSSIRESPINTLGSGDLDLSAFEVNNNPKPTLTLPLTPSHSSDNLHDLKRALSPDIVNRQLPVNNQLTTAGTSENKKIRRKSFNTSAVNNGTVTSIRSDSEDYDSDDDEDTQPNGALSVNGTDVASDGEDLDQIIDYTNLKYASNKRNKDFHQIFKRLPATDPLIDDFSCALSKDILVQGRMYLSSHYICFNSNILGWVTNLVIPLQEVIQIEKKSTAVLFKNGMIIRTLHHKHTFATFLSRDSTFNLITTVWHKVLLENSDIDPSKLFKVGRGRNGSKTSLTSRSFGDEDSNDISDEEGSSNIDGILSSSEHDENFIDDDDDDDDVDIESDSDISLNSDTKDKAETSKDIADSSGKEDEKRSSSEEATSTPATAAGNDSGNGFKGLPLVGPLAHGPTENGYAKQPNDTFISDEILKAPVGVVFLLLFGGETSHFIKILKAQKNFDIEESNITEISTKSKERHYTYIKPLSGPIGPKQTKCIIEDKLVDFQPEKCILVEQTTQTPDVPSGSSFKVKTKIFLSWADHNYTRLYVITTVEWSAKSWIKGAIEKGSIDGQKDSMKVMLEYLNDVISTGASAKAKPSKSKKKSRSRKNTIVKQPSFEKPIEVKPIDKTAWEQLNDFIESLGKLVPIPYLSSMISGYIVFVVGFIIFSNIFNTLTHRTNTNVQIIGDDKLISRIKINNNKYLVIPTVETTLKDQKLKMDNEVELWTWLNKVSKNEIKISGIGNESFDEDKGQASSSKSKRSVNSKYSDQEIEEIIRLTQLKLDQLSQRFQAQLI